jgi:hypothetical protein
MMKSKGSFIRLNPSVVVSRFIIALVIGIGYVSPSYAYLDPGTGSIILQGLLAAIAGMTAALGMFWQRIKFFFSSLFSPKKPKDPTPEQDSDQ